MYLEKHNIDEETVVERTEDSVLLAFRIEEKCDFFDGHFPEIHLVPAVAQIDTMINLANKYLGTSRFFVSAKRIKFSAPVLPNTDLHLSMKFNKEKNAIVYKLTTAAEDKTFSSGTLAVAEK